jgi:uncharacterized DUF497 family protein
MLFREDYRDYAVPPDLASEFDWDPVKARVNRQEHRTDFSMAVRIWQEKVIERSDARRDYGEERIQAFGKIDGRTMVVIFTWRGTKRRIISARKANRREQRFFEKAVQDHQGR